MGKLGKGLGALIPDTPIKTDKADTLSVSSIIANKFQPRRVFDAQKLTELKDSIREKGVIQPIVVRQIDSGYEIIAGERRFRAIKELGIEKIPAIIKNVSDEESLEFAIIENIQREDLNVIEEANGYRRLSEEFEMSQDNIAKVVGKDKSAISHILRLLTLPDTIQQYISENLLSFGHAKVLLGLDNDHQKKKTAKKIIQKKLSVRETENLIKKHKDFKAVFGKTPHKDHNIMRVEEVLQQALGTKVTLCPKKKKGKIEIQYYSNEDLERIINIITK